MQASRIFWSLHSSTFKLKSWATTSHWLQTDVVDSLQNPTWRWWQEALLLIHSTLLLVRLYLSSQSHLLQLLKTENDNLNNMPFNTEQGSNTSTVISFWKRVPGCLTKRLETNAQKCPSRPWTGDAESMNYVQCHQWLSVNHKETNSKPTINLNSMMKWEHQTSSSESSPSWY